MTAYARAQQSNEFGEITIEIRSVNHRYLETNFRIPEDFKNKEAEYRTIISQYAKRGKLDIALRYKYEDTQQASFSINQNVVEELKKSQQSVCDVILEAKPLSVAEIMQWPGVLNEPTKDFAPLFELTKQTLETCLKEFVKGREKEGSALKEMITSRCQQMSEIIHKIEEQRPVVKKAIEDKWRNAFSEKLSAWSDSIDPGRVEQELLVIAQKLDIDEETDRLHTHLKEVNDVLNRDEAIGRRLDFLMQELNREANTLSSKSQDSQTTQLAVDLKVLIEQMREQVQNIE